MKTTYYVILILAMLAVSCDTKHTSTNEARLTTTEVKDSTESEAVKDSCEIYKKDYFRTEFECLYFENGFSYEEYVEQVNSVNDCNKFYSDLKIKNDSVCKKYKCSQEELREHCIDLFSYEDDTLNKRNDCIEKNCSRNKFRSECDGYEDLCVEAIILGCLSKSGLTLNDYNIRSCAINNKSLIQRKCTTEACITDEVKECADAECEIKPSEEYLRQCAEKEKDTCTTQNRVRLF